MPSDQPFREVPFVRLRPEMMVYVLGGNLPPLDVGDLTRITYEVVLRTTGMALKSSSGAELPLSAFRSQRFWVRNETAAEPPPAVDHDPFSDGIV